MGRLRKIKFEFDGLLNPLMEDTVCYSCDFENPCLWYVWVDIINDPEGAHCIKQITITPRFINYNLAALHYELYIQSLKMATK